MFHRDASRTSPRWVHSIAVLAVLAAVFSSGRGWAVDAGSPPPKENQTTLVAAQAGPASTAQNTLNVICRAADLPHPALPTQRVPAEMFLSPADAKNTVEAIQKRAKTQRPLCSSTGAAPDKVLKLIDKAGRGAPPIGGPGTNPIGGPGNYPDAVIRNVFDQIKGNEQ
jgi:hypothetical protein